MTIRTTNRQNDLLSYDKYIGKVYRFNTGEFTITLPSGAKLHKLLRNEIWKASIREKGFVRVDKFFVSRYALEEFNKLANSHDN